MKEDSKLSETIKGQVIEFASKIAEGLKLPMKKFITQMLYGIQASKDVKLSNIARSLKENIRLIKVENRLSRNLGSRDLTDEINRKLIEHGESKIKDDTVIAVDISEITKEYAKAMEYLATVRNGSMKGELKSGYWLNGIFGAGVKDEELVPLYAELYSHEADDFESENKQIHYAMDMIYNKIGKRGIWAMDRGNDRKCRFLKVLQMGVKFVIRLDGDRHLILRSGTKKLALRIAQGMGCSEQFEVTIQKDGVKETKVVRLGCTSVKLPFWKEDWLRMVIVKGFGEEPLMLLTNVEGKSEREILEIYLTRWKCEESFRFLKQSYHLEDVRVRGYIALRNIAVLVQATFQFLTLVLGMKMSLRILLSKILAKAKRFFEIAEFKYYAIADGIYWILIGSKGGPVFPKKPVPEETGQLSLF